VSADELIQIDVVQNLKLYTFTTAIVAAAASNTSLLISVQPAHMRQIFWVSFSL